MRWAISVFIPYLGRIHLSSDRDGLLPEMKIIGYAIAGNMRTRLVAEALHMAVRNQPPIVGETVFHSDRGSQYTSAELRGSHEHIWHPCLGG